MTPFRAYSTALSIRKPAVPASPKKISSLSLGIALGGSMQWNGQIGKAAHLPARPRERVENDAGDEHEQADDGQAGNQYGGRKSRYKAIMVIIDEQRGRQDQRQQGEQAADDGEAG